MPMVKIMGTFIHNPYNEDKEVIVYDNGTYIYEHEMLNGSVPSSYVLTDDDITITHYSHSDPSVIDYQFTVRWRNANLGNKVVRFAQSLHKLISNYEFEQTVLKEGE